MNRDAVLAFIKRRKIMLALLGLLLSLLVQVPFVADHYVIKVTYCDDLEVEESCSIVSDNLMEAVENLIEGSLSE